jgi:hypothetical protein
VTAARRIRKQVYELTERDLAEHPAWEFCLDEEDRRGQDEATVRPVTSGPIGFGVVRTEFRAAGGRIFVGYSTPSANADLSQVQPIIVTPGGQVDFWLGLMSIEAAAAHRARAYDLLGADAVALFPISYRADAGWSEWPVNGSIEGFGRYRKRRFRSGWATVRER